MPKKPFLDVANGVLAAPMKQGLRVTTGAALVPMDAPIDTRQLKRGEKALNELMDLGKQVEEPQWLGTRPCLPDMLPLVGEAPNHKGLWWHFGYGQQSFNLGASNSAVLWHAMDGYSTPMLEGRAPSMRF